MYEIQFQINDILEIFWIFTHNKLFISNENEVKRKIYRSMKMKSQVVSFQTV